MIPSTSGLSTSHPLASNFLPIEPTRVARQVKSVDQGNKELKPYAKSAAEREPAEGGRKRIAAMRDKKRRRIEELMQNVQKHLEQQEQMQKRINITHSVMMSKQNDPSCSEEGLAQLKQRYVVELDALSASYDTFLAETMELVTLGADPVATQRQCDLLVNLVINARKQIVIVGQDHKAAECKYTDSKSKAAQFDTAPLTEGAVVEDGFLGYMGECYKNFETALKLHTEVGKRLLQLQGMSHQGAEDLEQITRDRPENEVSVLSAKLRVMDSLRYLSAKEPGSDTSTALQDTTRPLLLVSTSDIELQVSKRYEPGDRIAVLDDLIEQYDTALVRLKSIGIFNIDELHPAKFSRLCEIVQQLHDDAVRRLTNELRDMADSEKPSPTPTTKQFPAKRPPSSHSPKQVIRGKGVLISDVPPRTAKLGAETFESAFEGLPFSPLPGLKLNAWVEPRTPAPKARSTPYSHLKGEARKVLAKIDEQMQKFESYARGTSNPKGIEESLQNTAKVLTDYADRLENHETAPSSSPNDVAFINELRGQAQTINDKATQLRTQMSLAQAPTSTAVEYLLSRNEIHIQKNGERIQLKTGRQDFMQEFVLLNRDNQPLWYAHLHYETSNSANVDYTAASLKTKEQRFETKASALAKAQSSHQTIDIHRGAISKTLAGVLLQL